MKVLHISPLYFGITSYVGGGERYVVELARAMADRVPTTLVSFGSRRQSFEIDKLRVEIYAARTLHGRQDQPFNIGFVRELADAEVIHCHQVGTSSTVAALLAARALRRRRHITPLGLRPSMLQDLLIRLGRPSQLLCLSQFSAERVNYDVPIHIIYGGVDLRRFGAQTGVKERKVVYVGRLLPHKGVNYLIEAVDPAMRLELYGPAYDERYYSHLRRVAANKNVAFFTEATDEDVARAYTSALVSVLPSVYLDMYGRWHPEPELLGLVLLEAMASGTAVVGTRVGSIPEIIQDGATGYLVPPNDAPSLRAVLRRLLDDPSHASELGRRGRELVRQEFTWPVVADRCLAAYG